MKAKTHRRSSGESNGTPKSLHGALHKMRKERKEKPPGLLGKLQDLFRRAAARIARAMGSPFSFAIALAAVVVWAVLGKHYQYSENWQLVINTGTTIVTFLMIFLVQNTQNRDSRAIQLKLDELLRGVKGARTDMVDLEDATDEELEALQHEFERLRKKQPSDDEPSEHHPKRA